MFEGYFSALPVAQLNTYGEPHICSTICISMFVIIAARISCESKTAIKVNVHDNDQQYHNHGTNQPNMTHFHVA